MMSDKRQISRVGLAVRQISAALFLGLAAFGQEDQIVSFDPRETGELTLDWKTVIIGLLLALACGALWKLLMWLLESKRATVNWTKVRFWWPTSMLVWSWVMLAMFIKSESWGWLFDSILFLFGLLNFPVLFLVGIAVGLLNETSQLPAWL